MEIKGAVSLDKIMETMANVTKTTANLTDGEKKAKKDVYREGDTNSQQHQQTVEVHVGDQKEQPKPVIIKEKPETHIHKHFPDNRALTKEECDLEEIRIRLQHESEEQDRKIRWEIARRDREDRKEREEYERKERLRKEAEQKKRRRARTAFAGACIAGGLGLIGYGIYTDFRRAKIAGNLSLPAGGETTVIKSEGTVE